MTLRGRLLAGAGTVLVLGAANGQAAAATPKGDQQLVRLFAAHDVHAAPAASAPVLAQVRPVGPLTGAPTTLPVLAQVTDAGGRQWLRVRLPGRQLGSPAPPKAGWITADHARRLTTAWRLIVDVRRRQLTVLLAGRRVRRFMVIVGAARTPTPRGQFFVEENVRLGFQRVAGPFALALSARSSVLQEFDGGPGQIAVHGRRHLGGRLGTAVSHGCVRLGDRDITWLAARIGPGVPVTIR